MNHPGGRLWIAPLLLVAAAGCSTLRSSPPEPAPSREAGAMRRAQELVAQADDLTRRGQARAALAAYDRVLREHPGDPAGAAALYALGRLQADRDAGLRDYRAAHRALSRLLADYPGSDREAEARTWRAVIADLIAREDEAARLKARIERLRRTDLELERRR